VRELEPDDGARASAILAAQEERLRVLHALRTEARLIEGFEAGYVGFVRALRERLHPRGVPDIRTVTLEDGLSLSVDVGDRLGCDVFYGYYEEAFDARVFTRTLPSGATVIDVGANFGFYTLQSARAAGASATIHAFEPDPNALAVLRSNIEANGLGGRVLTWQVAVGETDGTVELQLAAESAFTSIRPTGRSEMRGSVEVPLRSLDSFAAEHGVAAIDALKIDAEGLEGQILNGARALLRASPDPLIQLEVSAKNLTDVLKGELITVLDALLAEGFVALRPDARCDEGLSAVEKGTTIAHLTNTNVFLVRAGGAAERRLREAAQSELGEPTAMLSVRTADEDRRSLRLYQGLDPALVASALDEREALRRRVSELEAAQETRTQADREVVALRTASAQSDAIIERQSAEVQELRMALENAKQIIRERSASTPDTTATIAHLKDELVRLHQHSAAVIERQSAEVAELRDALERASAMIERRQAELTEQRTSDAANEQVRSWRAMVDRQDAELQQLRGDVERARAQADDWRTLAERLVAENDDRRDQREDSEGGPTEKRDLVDQLWTKLAAARADRDVLQARCTEQMHEIWRLRDEQSLPPGDVNGGVTRRLG
jgi:FkbM family methyltransferase